MAEHLDLELVDTLRVARNDSKPDGFLAAGSGLEVVGAHAYVVADDEARIATFDVATGPPARWISLTDEVLPSEHAERKAAKPDLEAVVALPGDDGKLDLLLAVPSGSTGRRRRAFAFALDPSGAIIGPATPVDMGPVFDRLAHDVGVPNVEGAVVLHDVVVLLARGVTGANFVATLALCDVRDGVNGGAIEPASLDARAVDLGSIGHVPLGFTDGAVLDGVILFSAAAEDTSNAYDDGDVLGSAIGRLEFGADRPASTWLLPAHAGKVEGIAITGSDLLLVTDDDNPHHPARLFRTRIPS